MRVRTGRFTELTGKKLKYTSMVINGIDIGMNNGHNKMQKMVISLEVFYARSQNSNIA